MTDLDDARTSRANRLAVGDIVYVGGDADTLVRLEVVDVAPFQTRPAFLKVSLGKPGEVASVISVCKPMAGFLVEDPIVTDCYDGLHVHESHVACSRCVRLDV